MLIGPRMHDGEQGYMVVTPLERGDDPSGGAEGEGGAGTTVLVNRGWISKANAAQRQRPDGLPAGRVTVEGLLRKPWKKNMFTPDNRPDKGEFYFPDVEQMARLTGSQPVWVEQTMSMIIPRYSVRVEEGSTRQEEGVGVRNGSVVQGRESRLRGMANPPFFFLCRPGSIPSLRLCSPWDSHREAGRGEPAQQPRTVYLHLVWSPLPSSTQLSNDSYGDLALTRLRPS